MIFSYQPDYSRRLIVVLKAGRGFSTIFWTSKQQILTKFFKFKFAKFWWFCLLEIPWPVVSALRVTFRDKHLAVCHCPFMRSMHSVWDIFFDLYILAGLSRKSQASFLGYKGWHAHYLLTPFIKPAKFTRVQSLLLFRWFPTTSMNAITCAEMFSFIPIKQQASDLRKPSRAIQKSVLDFVAHSDSKVEVKIDPTFHGTPGKQKNKQFGRWGLKTPHCRPLFSGIFDNSRIFDNSAPSLYNPCNHAYVPGQHM